MIENASYCDFPQFLVQAKYISSSLLSDITTHLNTAFKKTELSALSHQTNLSIAELEEAYDKWESYPQEDLKLSKLAPQQLPKRLAEKHHALILDKHSKNTRHIVMSNPSNNLATKAIREELNINCVFYLAKDEEITKKMLDLSLTDDRVNHYARHVSSELLKHTLDYNHQELASGLTSDNSTITHLINHIFERAIDLDATDIHIEATGDNVVLMYRVATLLSERETLPISISNALRQKLFMLGHGDILLTHKLQDLGFRFSVKNSQTLDVRFSYLPTLGGYAIVMRLIKSKFHSLDLADIFYNPDDHRQIEHFIHGGQGLFLAAGPTGSGKSTLLYAMLHHLIKKGNSKIITIEDPVEADIPGANQVLVNPEIGMDFSDVIRSALRQDPDILMIGEIRDSVTAKMACRAAMTGVMVMASLHAPSSIDTVTRLIDLKAEPFILGSGLRFVIATRLVQLICQYCKVDYTPTKEELLWLKSCRFPTSGYRHGVGCSYCHQRGSNGMTGIYEMLAISQSMKEQLHQKKINKFNRLAADAIKKKNLIDNAIAMAQSGMISLQEAMKIGIVLDGN